MTVSPNEPPETTGQSSGSPAGPESVSPRGNSEPDPTSPGDRPDTTEPAPPQPPAGHDSVAVPTGESTATSESPGSPDHQPQAEPTQSAPPPAEASQHPEPLMDTRIAGTVQRLTPERVMLQLEDGREGYVPIIEFAAQPIPVAGDRMSVIIEKEDPKDGSLVLSKQQADELGFWQAVQPGDALDGVVTGMNKGGLDVDIGGARAFLPASQVDVRRIRDISNLIGEHVRCIVTQVDRTTRDLVVSRRKAIELERQQKRAQAIADLEPGQTCTGKITSITDYGAFVNIGAVEGLLHVTDMSWGRVNHPRDVVSANQQIEVQILKINRDKAKVSLGLKQLKPNPWDNIREKYPEGSRITGKVARLAGFGAFIELEEGVDALLPVSEMSWSRRVGNPADIVKVEDQLEVVVLQVDPEKRRISVGLKQTTEDPWSAAVTQFPVNSKVKGSVRKIADFGAFVEIAPGVEGLVHISELSVQRVRSVQDVLQEGQEVEVRVLKVDPEAQRISLTLRPERQRPAAPELRAEAARKKRKRPLRGGLASHFDW
jgi:small subunit ribosomal protein S1